MKISHNRKQDTSSEKNNSKTVEIGNKTNERKQCQEQKIFNYNLERSAQKAKPILQRKWKYLKMWNKILLQKRIVHKQLKLKTKQIKKSNVKNKKYLEIN